jgi:hypothetical protein
VVVVINRCACGRDYTCRTVMRANDCLALCRLHSETRVTAAYAPAQRRTVRICL